MKNQYLFLFLSIYIFYKVEFTRFEISKRDVKFYIDKNDDVLHKISVDNRLHDVFFNNKAKTVKFNGYDSAFIRYTNDDTVIVRFNHLFTYNFGHGSEFDWTYSKSFWTETFILKLYDRFII